MNTNSLKFLPLVLLLSFVTQSCSGPSYAQSDPQPVYTPPPPPPPTTYNDEPVQPQQPDYDAPPPVTYQSFYDEMSPYGQWVNSPVYGYVWVPYAGPDFQPYGTSGHWVLTNYGWTWVSDYPWGWAAFHYGRWDFDSFYGWYWIPGYEWSPAWVSWRSSPGYYGWCPLGPTYVNGGYVSYSCPPERYVFVRTEYINSPVIVNYYEPRTQYVTYYSRSTVVTNTYYDNSSRTTYYAGPPREEVERYTKTPIRPANTVQTSTPERGGVSNNEVRIFRPAVQQPTANAPVRPAPSKVAEKTEIAPITQRPVLTHGNQQRVAPYKPENTQRGGNQPVEQNRQQPPVQQQRPPAQEQQQPAQQQRPPAQQPQNQPAQQQRPPMQEQRPPAQQPQTQQPVQQQRPPVQEQQQPAQQQRPPVQEQQQPVQQQRPPQQQSQNPPHPAQQQRKPKQQKLPKPQKQQRPQPKQEEQKKENR